MSSLLFLYTCYSDWQSLSDLNAMSEKYSSGSATQLLTGDGGGPVGTVNQMLDVSMSAEGLFQVYILVIVMYICIYICTCLNVCIYINVSRISLCPVFFYFFLIHVFIHLPICMYV